MPGSKNNKNCEATLSYRIKNISRGVRTDTFMNEVPPKPGILKIKLIHSHRLDPPENIDYMVWSQEMKKPVEERSEDGSDSIENKVIKEEIDSDCETAETVLPDIYQLPLKRKSYHPLTRIGRPPLTTHRLKDSPDRPPNPITFKNDQGSQTLPEELLPIPVATSSETNKPVPADTSSETNKPATANISSEVNKTESTSDQPPKVNVFIIQMKAGTSPFIPNFEVKPGQTPILPKFEVKPGTTPLTPSFGQNATNVQQNTIPSTIFFNAPQEFISSDKGPVPQLLYTNNSNVAQTSHAVNSVPYPISMSNTNAPLNTTKNDELILPVITTITSEKSGETIKGNFSTACTAPDPNNNPQNKLSNPSMAEEFKDRPAYKLEPVAKPIRNPQLKDLEVYKNLSRMSQEKSPLEIDGEQYIPKEMGSLDIYGLHVAERLRKLDKKTREFVQKSIDGLMFDAEIGLGDFTYEKSPTSSPSELDEKSDTLDSESTWSVLSDQVETCSQLDERDI